MIRCAELADAGLWDRYVQRHPAATFFHRYHWSQVIEQSFGHAPHYLMASKSGEVVGILPLIHKTSAIFGNALISLPFLMYGGVVADDPDVARDLQDHAVGLAEQLGVGYLELRHFRPTRSDWLCKDKTYATFNREIPADREAIIKSVPAKGRRHALRRSLKQDLAFEIQDDLDEFYSVLSESYRNLGTPIFPRHYFTRMIETFGADFEIYVVRAPSGPVAASLTYGFRDHVYPFYVGGTPAARALNANDFLFLSIMCRALERGYGRFDFGRTKFGTGSFAYKTYWGFEPQPLHYEYKLFGVRKMPDLNPLNPRYSPFVSMWRRLPLVLSSRLGPPLARHLG